MNRLIFPLLLALTCVLVPATAHALPHYSQAYTKTAIRYEAKRAGYGKTQTDALLALAYRESRWHNWSHATSQCHGVYQLSKGMAHGHPWWNPYWNTRRAIRYIKYSSHNYRTPTRALAHSRRFGWY